MEDNRTPEQRVSDDIRLAQKQQEEQEKYEQKHESYNSLEEILKAVSSISVGYEGVMNKEEVMDRLQKTIDSQAYLQKDGTI